MSIFVLVFAALLLGLMDWSQSVLESWPLVAGIASGAFAAAVLARKQVLPKLLFASAGLLGVLVLAAAALIRFLVHWMSLNVPPVG